MVGEAIAGLGALKTAFDLAKGLKDIDDAARRNAAIIELQEKILGGQSAQAALVERINELEAKVAAFEAWKTEKQRYQLKDFGGGTFAYELKPEEARGEPAHRLCPACYENGHKSIIQNSGQNTYKQNMAKCPACKSDFSFGIRQELNLQPRNYNPRRS